MNSNACSECMVCVSVCPSEALTVDMSDFYRMIDHLGEVPSAVLGCRTHPEVRAHEKTFCLGVLSEEHLIGLSVLVHQPIQLNLTKCGDCKNGSIVPILSQRLIQIAARTSIKVSEKIKLVDDEADLEYKEVSYERRLFFKALKNVSVNGYRKMFDGDDPKQIERSYSDKILPLKRRVLIKTLSHVSDEIRKGLLNAYFYNISMDSRCNLCNACVKICPTGALRSNGKEIPKLQFAMTSCIGCRLCEDFCRKKAVQVKKSSSDKTVL